MNVENTLQCKNFDMIILNSMNDAGAAFEHETNKLTIIQSDVIAKEFLVKHKTEVANDIIMQIAGILMQSQIN